ncbi:ATP-dependent permease [Lithohypha guttulata]|uniref:ATP-dependent permease n=1 Tax=Lithohypha guttulata TaxID=1690604 RepID=A0AAN7Y9T6_9EURO|nr:ATP-dependent permease [Lithohypha guttulata]
MSVSPNSKEQENPRRQGGLAAYRVVFSFNRPGHLFVLIPAVLLAALSGTIKPAMSILTGHFFTSFAQYAAGTIDAQVMTNSTRSIVYAFIVVAAITWLAKAAVCTTWITYGEMQAAAVREDLFSALIVRDLAWFEAQEAGVSSLLSRIHTSQIFKWLFRNRYRQAITDQQAGLTLATQQVNHAIKNVVLVKCHNTESSEVQHYVHILDSSDRHLRRQTYIAALQTGFMRIAAALVMVLALGFGTYLVHKGGASPGEILTTFWSAVSASTSFNELLPQIFSYPVRPDRYVLGDVTLFFPAHETTFVVGRSGSGKSTLGALLLRFYSANRGCITIDGTKIHKLDTRWLRNNVTLVQQDSVLFRGTLRENITMCFEDYTSLAASRITDCLDFAQLQHATEALPDGLETKIGKGGSDLSGGQRQRLALARARLRDTPVLVLDESTSALDHTAKIHIMRNLREWRSGKTTIIITHDMSQIRSGDFMYAFKDGRIISEGYRSTAESQLQQSLNHDMIGNPLVPIEDDSEQFQTQIRRTQYFQRPQPARAGANLSVSSFESGFSASTLEEHRRLLDKADDRYNINNEFRRSLKVVKSKHAKRQFVDESLHIDFELETMSKSQKWGDRLTRTPAVRPYSMHPSTTLRPTHLQQDLAVAKPARPITIWQDVAENTAVVLRGAEETAMPQWETYLFRDLMYTVWSSLSSKHRRSLIFAFITAVSYAALPSMTAWLMAKMFTNFYQDKGWVRDAVKWSGTLIAICFLDGVAAFIIQFLFETCGQAWIQSLRQLAVTRILIQSKTWFDNESLSLTEICSSLDKSAEDVRDLLGRLVSFVLIAIVMVVIALTWSLITCWKLSLTVVACVPVIYAVTKLLDFVSTRWQSRSNDAAIESADIFAESFSDVRTVRALTLESRFHRKYTTSISITFRVGLRRGFYVGICYGASESLLSFTLACIFTYGTTLATSQQFTTKSILTVLSLMLHSMLSASSILTFVPRISSSIEAGNRLLKLTNLPSYSQEQKGLLKLQHESFTATINFNRLTFHYPNRPTTAVLNNFDLTIGAGQFIAVVGRSGCGKSTIIFLILGLYLAGDARTASRSLQISGHDIHSLDLASLRSHIAYMPQDAVLFPISIRENILYGLETQEDKDTRSDERLHTAARSTGIHDFITSLPSGYDTIVSDGGQSVSGGQAQRIALARVFARRPKILLLDEPTSALDRDSAEVIRQSLLALTKLPEEEKPTIIVVTHNKEMMEIADRVVMLKNGAVVEDGGFEALMRRRGDLWNLMNAVEE